VQRATIRSPRSAYRLTYQISTVWPVYQHCHSKHASTTKKISGFPPIGRGRSSCRMALPPPLLLQPGHHQRSSPASSGIYQQHQAGYNTVSVGSIDGFYAKYRRTGDGQSPGAAQQPQMAGYASQKQYQGQTQAHWFGSGAQPTNRHISQPSRQLYGDSPTPASPSCHAHVTPALTRDPSLYAAPIPLTTPSQWASGCSPHGQEWYYHPLAYSQPVQVHQPQQPYTLLTHAKGTYQVQNPAGSTSSGSESIKRSTLVAHEPTPHSATAPLVTSSLSSSAGFESVAAVFPATPQIHPGLTLPFCGDHPTRYPSGPSMRDAVPNSSPANGSISWNGVLLPPPAQPEGPWASSAGVSFNSYHPMNTLQFDQSPAPMLDLGRHLPLSVPPHLTPTEVSPTADDFSCHLRPSLAPVNLVVPCQNLNHEVTGSGSDIATNGEPMSPNRRIGPDRSEKTHSRRESRQYLRPAPYTKRKTRPATFEGNIKRLQQRCKRQGADEGALGYLGKIFATGVSMEALMRPLTDEEVENEEFGVGMGRVYTALLKLTNGGESVALRYTCRLCRSDQTWKHSKDALRHLRRNHFDLADVCPIWYVFSHSLTVTDVNALPGECSNQRFYARGELTRHPCKQIKRNA
jgi:hypothetical protein